MNTIFDYIIIVLLLYTMYRMTHWYRIAQALNEINGKLQEKIADLQTQLIIHGIKNNENKH